MPRHAVLVAFAALLAAGCGTVEVPARTAPASARPALPAGVQDPAPVPTTPAATPGCDPADPETSLRPTGPLPAPGRMPAGSAMDRIVRRGVLVAGVDQNLRLFGSIVDGELVGYDIDYVRAIARALFGDPGRVRFRAVTSANRIELLTSGEIDLIADSMSITCERLAQVDFSTNYFTSGQRVMVRADSRWTGIDDLGGRKVCAPAGTTSLRYIAERRPAPVPVSVVDWTDCLVLLQQGYVEAISTTDTILLGLRQQDPTTRIVGDRFTTEPHGIAVRKTDPDLLRFVNALLERMRADGSWERIYRTWLRELDRTVPAPPPARYGR